jgi:MFS family permease
LGLFVGYLIFSYYSDKYGRKKSMILALLIAIVGNFIVSISINLLMAVIGLFFAGVGGNSSMTIVFYFLT